MKIFGKNTNVIYMVEVHTLYVDDTKIHKETIGTSWTKYEDALAAARMDAEHSARANADPVKGSIIYTEHDPNGRYVVPANRIEIYYSTSDGRKLSKFYYIRKYEII